VAVVVAAENYPGPPRTGDVVDGLPEASREDGVTVLHAGTSTDADGRVVTSGGRVLAVTAVGADVAEARAKAYAGVDALRIEGSHHRTDIAAGV
jgi:phosphoribosylamine---glycine ligase